MPNNTKEPPCDDWKPDPVFMNKSWVELAAEEDDDAVLDGEEENINKTPEKTNEIIKPEEKSSDDKRKAFKRIDFGQPIKEEIMESPMKVESPLKEMDSPLKLDIESPMKLEMETPEKIEVKVEEEERSPAITKADVTKRLWASPRRRDANRINLGPRVSPRRPTAPPGDLMSPPREALKRKRNKDLFNCASPASSIGSPGSERSLVSPRPKRKPVELETDPEVLNRRQKQIDYGKNTEGYRCYVESIPKSIRSHKHPQTPPRDHKYSRRAWDGMIRAWRQQLHMWDPPGMEGPDTLDCLDTTDSMSEISVGSGSLASDSVSELSYPGSGTKHRPQRPTSTLSLDEFPPLA